MTLEASPGAFRTGGVTRGSCLDKAPAEGAKDGQRGRVAFSFLSTEAFLCLSRFFKCISVKEREVV